MPHPGRKILGGTQLSNRILWIAAAFFILFLIIGSFVFVLSFDALFHRLPFYEELSSGMVFTLENYLVSFLPLLVWLLLYCFISKKNRFLLDTLKAKKGSLSALGKGLLFGFLMNGACVLAAWLHRDIVLEPNFALSEIPFYLLALCCVFIQSTTEEVWCRGFLQERIHIHYPFWLAALLNAAIFGALHLMNPGISKLAVVNLVLTGVAYSFAMKASGSIWFPMGLHTAWNFTQNYLFGLPNSGLVSEISVFKLVAANARDTLIYDNLFGVEGSIPAAVVTAAMLLFNILFILKKGRGEILLNSKEKEGFQEGNV